ncbi:deoxyribose-phosphate aldolase [candidate division KSB1 bacterium]|nr:deoxyribose-phosphate aldolase [candidate division KSB1 bacterium]MBL7092899.1 deoxyribose-phosphate aldolase [candidate division KSB1 bacterium]
MNPESNTKKIAIGSDHSGFELKEKLKHYLTEKGYTVFDCGTHSTEAVDYPAMAFNVAKLISDGKYEKGIIIDGAGIGSSMAANKVDGVRAALCYDVSSARNSREHNDANVLTLGAGLIGFALAQQIADIWLTTECTVDRHLRRVKMIEEIEKGKLVVDSNLKNNGTSTGEKNLSEISTSDLDKIAEKIAAMFSRDKNLLPSTTPANCDNETCIDCGQCADKAPDTIRKFIDLGLSRVSNAPGGIGAPTEFSKYIDHTILKPEATKEQVETLCKEAVEFSFASVCINPTYVKLAHELTKDSNVDVCTVVGFPLGANLPEIKAMETRRAIREGSKEIDMVINIGALKSGDFDLVFKDIRAVVDACVDGSAICKVIIEAALLTDDEKIKACELSKKARAHYVKTSTGFAKGGATAHDVALMSKVVSGTSMGVKAAGGIRTLEDAQEMIEAGATRLGASAGVKIVQQAGLITES